MHLTMRPRTQSFAAAALLALGLTGASAAHGATGELLAGDYPAKGTGVKATVTVADSGDGKVRFSLKASCGTVKGSVALDAASGGLKGKRVNGKGSTTVRVNDEGDGDISGSIRYAATDDGEPCKAKRAFTGSLDADTSDDVQELIGHYDGTGDDGGRPISFDVAYDRGSDALEVRNLGFLADTECWNDLDGDGTDDTLVANISGLSGEVDYDGNFEIDYTPDADTEYYVEGALAGGEAELYVEVGGFFAPDGTPQAGGPLECDSWGEDYFAVNHG